MDIIYDKKRQSEGVMILNKTYKNKRIGGIERGNHMTPFFQRKKSKKIINRSESKIKKSQ